MTPSDPIIIETPTPANAADVAQRLPTVESDLAPSEILARLDTASRRGRLPGYQATGERSFRVAAFGTPFDGVLDGEIASAAPGGATRIRFRAAVARKAPTIFLVTSLLAAWPGVWLTDSMLRLYFSWYHFNTYMWYLPLTLIPLPWMWRRSMRRSRAEIAASTGEQIAAITKEVGGRVVDASVRMAGGGGGGG